MTCISFSNDLEVVSKIPVLPCLIDGGTSVTLLQWINSKHHSNLEQRSQQCLNGIHQVTPNNLYK